MRFGSVKFNEVDESDLNQPTAMSQQNAGTVARANLLRTDMDPIISDNKTLPEVITTISLNATQRDDVNDVLRPLVAMQRRCPFVGVRNNDLARLMLGLGVAEDTETRLRSLYPDLDDERITELSEQSPDDFSNIWIPVTLRQISVDTQPGAADLFQLHVVMRFANVMPYVPELKYWRTTEKAIEWARYVSMRSMRGTDIGPPSGGVSSDRKLGLPTNSVVTASPPSDMESQTPNPYKSYPFRKMYLGLLEEYQPAVSGGAYDNLLQQDKFDQLEPIGHTPNGEPIYEPAYPISDPARTFEEYDSDSPIGLQYVTPSDGANPQARFQEILDLYEQKINFADRMDAALEAKRLTSDHVAGLKETGKISPWVIGPGRKFSKIALSIKQTSSTFGEVLGGRGGQGALESAVSDFTSQMTYGAETELMKSKMRKYDINFENGELTSQEQSVEITGRGFASESQRKTAALLDGNMAGSVLGQKALRPAGAFGEGGVLSFDVPDRKHEEIVVPFGQRYSELQRGVLATYLNLLEQMGNAENWSDYTKAPEAEWSVWFDQFMSEEIRNYAKQKDIDLSSKSADQISTEDPLRGGKQVSYVQYEGGFKEWIPEGFGSYVLTYDFKKKLDARLDKLDKELDEAETGDTTNVPPELKEARNDFQDLFEATQKLSKKTAQAIRGSRSSVEDFMEQNAQETYGYLALENAAIEKVSLEFSNNYGDREWDGYPHPVTQHLGGKNARVTIEFTTNNMLLMDQIGELKRSQQQISEQRKSRDVVPPLLKVTGAGNLLRAHGIKNLAYQSHTKNMADQKPGYYKVRMDFIQDEETLARHENFSRVGGSKNARKTAAQSVAPLTVPLVSDEAGWGAASHFAQRLRPIRILYCVSLN